MGNEMKSMNRTKDFLNKYNQQPTFGGWIMACLKKIIFCCLGVSLLWVMCKVDTISSTSGGKVADLKIVAGEVSGWIEDEDGYKEFNTVEELNSAINGAADKYFEFGTTEGIKQELLKETDATMTIRYAVLDCGSAENATALYNFMRQNFSIKAAVGTYDEATAIIDTDYLESVKALAHFGKYYVEVTPNRFPKSDMITTATTFIKVLKDKIDKLQ
jgi:hypothetical protein